MKSMTLVDRERLFAPFCARIFQEHGLPPEWGMAIARHESQFTPGAINNYDPGDVKRGWSWGLCQMSLLTAQALGFKGDPIELLSPRLNLELAAKLVLQDRKRVGENLAEIYSLYNSGKPLTRAPDRTKKAVALVVQYATQYRKEKP